MTCGGSRFLMIFSFFILSFSCGINNNNKVINNTFDTCEYASSRQSMDHSEGVASESFEQGKK